MSGGASRDHERRETAFGRHAGAVARVYNREDDFEARRDLRSAVVGIDPGDRHVGVAYWTLEGQVWQPQAAMEVEPRAVPQLISRLAPAVDLFVCEAFVLRSGTPQNAALGTTKVMGAVEAVASLHDRLTVWVTPSEVKATVARLKAAGYNFSKLGAGTHRRDAAAAAAAWGRWQAVEVGHG